MINTDSAVYFKFRFVFKELISTTNNNEKNHLRVLSRKNKIECWNMPFFSSLKLSRSF